MRPTLDVSDVPASVDLTAQSLDLQTDWSGRCVTARGELDSTSVSLLVRIVAELIDVSPGKTTVHIGHLTFIDASGMGGLVQLGNRLAAASAEFSVVGAAPRHRQLFEIVGLSALLDAS
ncbi:MAG: hypothetical protein QOD31_1581 [Pseudonocardiales bacterium]|jgi:anti-anti-sigma factor|nr:hypothetical protein [Pseudonocardiales bacterium]